MNFWIITDTHLGHDNIKEYCNRPDDFEEQILKSLAGIPLAGDLNSVLIHLGDVCIGNDEYWHTRLLSVIPCCYKWLVRGNHDSKSVNWYLQHGWDFVADSFTLNMFGGDILFSHVPKQDNGYMVNIHGHFHNVDHRLHEPILVEIKNKKQVLVAIEETNYKAVSLKSIIKNFTKSEWMEVK